jgi:hypothetical protein
MVNKSRNNAKSRRRSRRGGSDPMPAQEVIVDNRNIPSTTKVVIDDKNSPSKIEVDVETPKPGNESWATGLTSGITSGFNTLTDGAKNLVGENEEKGTLSSMTDSVTGFFTSSEPKAEIVAAEPVVAVSVEEPKPWYRSIFGGRRRSRRRQQQGGRGLGLNYYATPVNGLRVAEPTYMEYYKGGKRRSGKRRSAKRRSAKRRSGKRNTRRCKSKRCKKTCRKQHRHKRK